MSSGYILNDWQLAGVLTAGSGAAYDLVFNGSTYQSNGQAVNLTGSPNYNPKLVDQRRPWQRVFRQSVCTVQHGRCVRACV